MPPTRGRLKKRRGEERKKGRGRLPPTIRLPLARSLLRSQHVAVRSSAATLVTIYLLTENRLLLHVRQCSATVKNVLIIAPRHREGVVVRGGASSSSSSSSATMTTEVVLAVVVVVVVVHVPPPPGKRCGTGGGGGRRWWWRSSLFIRPPPRPLPLFPFPPPTLPLLFPSWYRSM